MEAVLSGVLLSDSTCISVICYIQIFRIELVQHLSHALTYYKRTFLVACYELLSLSEYISGKCAGMSFYFDSREGLG